MAFDWFCSNQLEAMITVNFSDSESFLHNVCLVDLVNVCHQTVFLVAFTVTLFILGCCTTLRQHKTRYLLTYPGHGLRWLLTLGLFIVLLGAVGEGIMTDLTRNKVTQPHLYLPQSLAFINCIISIGYYHHSESWCRPRMSWILFIYWTLSICSETIRLINLHYHDADTSILRFDIVICCIAIYALLLLVELNLVRTKVFKWCFTDSEYPEDLKRDDMYCIHRYTDCYGRLYVSWINWLFRLGYKQPIEMTDLGSLPEEHSVKRQYNILRKAYRAESARANKKGNSPSLFLAFGRAYGYRMFISFSLKVISDSFGFIGPIAIGGIVAYASLVYSGDQVPKNDTEYITFAEFFTNGFVLVGVISVTSVLRFLALQATFLIALMDGIHARTALQRFVYEKSFRLSSIITSSGEMSFGSITNHMSTDAATLRWWWMMLPVFISLPYVVIVVLILLYLQLGYAALLGASLFIIAIPVQFILAAKMSQLQKIVMRFADNRLKKSNELLQGIKLLKLYGWESIFCSNIESVRRKEVHEMLKLGCISVLNGK
ncbi:ATP-binding cassette sub-family C member 9-like [Ptychodera flava]|uniref:ATP-binding cassette sub-family C member 9-like n=1 Tax=Ptychodera flava TaxID=63121 RepID=UPI00396A3324